MAEKLMETPVHAGLVAARRDGRWIGALIEGPSGAGKSDLALRAIEAGFRLVADDRVILWASGGRLFGRSPASLFGLIEARGVGVTAAPALHHCEIGLVVRCAPDSEIERIPDPHQESRGGILLPIVVLWPLEPSAPAKMRHAIDHLGGRP
jgi:serine kinase of HPr protein (carbohydrate metabolism regulator)